MPQRLVVRLSLDPGGRVHWIGLDDDGRVDGHAESGSLRAAAEAAAGRQLIALAPADAVLLLSARIPTQSRQRMLQALPYALEDQLTDEVSNLHFAPGRRGPDGEVAVAVVAHERMRTWSEAFAEAGVEAEQVYPEVLALPYEEGAWTVLVEGDGFLLRSAPQAGFGGDLDNLPMLLEAALQEADEERPQRLLVYSAEGPLSLEGAELEVENRELPGSTTELLATALDAREAIALRTGRYARRRGGNAHWARWRLAAALLLAWALVDTGGALIQRWRADAQAADLQRQAEQVFRDTFPGAGPVLNPRLQMESRLAALRGGGNGGGALELLERVGPVLAAERRVHLTSLNYRGGDLDLELSAGSLQLIDELARRLGEVEGVQVEVTRASTEGERALGRLKLEASS